ncbi:MAG: sigma 54-interacting transcriptional regulator [Polyangiales bacterium]
MRAALEALAGESAAILDADLRVREATTEATERLGLSAGAPLAHSAISEASVRDLTAQVHHAHSADLVVQLTRGSGAVRVRAAALRAASRVIGYLVTFAPSASQDAIVQVAGMWTADPAMKQLFQLLARTAASDATVLVRGETGTGKELVARAIHDQSARASGPFHAVNCAAIPAALLESELFGHVRGSFTGAVRDNPGHFRLAHGGTLFLDEIAELPLDVQAKLLRVLETHSVLPVGGRESVNVDVRIVAATHRALRKEAEAGRFRADLMYRLRVIPLFLPPLRARRGDIPLLTSKILEELSARCSRHVPQVSRDALIALERHAWPGNVRELRNVLEYAMVMSTGAILQRSDLPPEVGQPEMTVDGDPHVEPSDASAPQSSAAASRIVQALAEARGSKTRAAEALGMSRVTLWRRMKELGLGVGR